ncbi:hypothetical protein ACFV5G_13040 [Streptomyces sp. NPDC059766]|uniref:hypothetical protein n=1 Tax=Streptomyces sp. NPDC059766 TaxID=3346940 RepID=UPI00365934C3
MVKDQGGDEPAVRALDGDGDPAVRAPEGDGEAAVRAPEGGGVDRACCGDLIGFLVCAFDLGPASAAAEGGKLPPDHVDGGRDPARRPADEA